MTLHLSVSVDSGTMFLEREGAVLREMPVRVGREQLAGTAPDTVRVAAPRGYAHRRRGSTPGQ